MNYTGSKYRRLQAIFPACARAQSWMAIFFVVSLCVDSPAAAETREEVVPEFDAFFKMDDRTRLFLKGAATRGEDADLSRGSDQYKSNEAAVSLDFTLQPILRARLADEDWEHNRYFWMRVGYHYLGKFYDSEKAENRGSVELDTRQPVSDNFWFTGRLKWDLRDIAGENAKRYGVRLGVERPFSAGGRALVPYAHAEVLYDTRYDTWNQQIYQTGIDIGLNNRWRVEPYFQYQENTQSEPAHVYAIGLIIKYYH